MPCPSFDCLSHLLHFWVRGHISSQWNTPYTSCSRVLSALRWYPSSRCKKSFPQHGVHPLSPCNERIFFLLCSYSLQVNLLILRQFGEGGTMVVTFFTRILATRYSLIMESSVAVLSDRAESWHHPHHLPHQFGSGLVEEWCDIVIRKHLPHYLAVLVRVIIQPSAILVNDFLCQRFERSIGRRWQSLRRFL